MPTQPRRATRGGGLRGAQGAWRPTREQLAQAVGSRVPDVIAPGLRVLFCGINPGLYSGAVGHHFARPGNRFWKVLWLAGFTDRELSPFEEDVLPGHGIGITNLVARATAAATDLRADELRAGVRSLRRKISRYRPGVLAVAGVGAYRTAFCRPHATIGPQPERLGGAALWVVANPSGAQARYQLDELVGQYRELRMGAGLGRGPAWC